MTGRRARVVPNGAADEFFDVATPASSTRPVAMFVGPASYEVNRAGMAWFVDRAWPRVLDGAPGARLDVVGPGWTDVLPADIPGVSARGFLPNLAGALAQARVLVAPLPAGGGTKIKVLEAMAAGRPVVTTRIGAEGIPSSPGLAVTDDEARFASCVAQWLTRPQDAASAGASNRAAVDGLAWPRIWSAAMVHLDDLVSSAPPPPAHPERERV